MILLAAARHGAAVLLVLLDRIVFVGADKTSGYLLKDAIRAGERFALTGGIRLDGSIGETG